jgi:GH25 family lysozyme M1 (1,4-beta-N-acetylmuramidase)
MPQIKFIARVTSMGKDKVIIYVPKDFHKDTLKNFKGKQVKVILEEAV